MNAFNVTPGLPEILNLFNPNRLPEIYNVPEPYMHFIFMTRPDLNIFDGAGNPLPNWASLDSYAYHLLYGENRQITKALTSHSPTIFVPFITSRVKGGYQIDNRSLKTIEKGNTYLGNNVQYGAHNNDHKKMRSISLEIANDRYLTAWKFHAAWRDYIDIVTFRSGFSPKAEYIYPQPVLDYAASIYYFVTKRDARTLVYWEKLYGVYPTSVPDDMFNSSGNGIIFEPTVNITYAVSIKSDPNSLGVLEDFNTLTTGKAKVAINLLENTPRGGKTVRSVLAEYPFLTKHASQNQYYLNWGGEKK